MHPMTILQLTASNVKRIRAVDISPNPADPLVKIGGANGQGKSSVLDSIMYALGGKKVQAAQPVRIGEQEAFVELDLGELTVRREWRANGTETLRVRTREGAAVGREQEKLNALISQVSFDPMGFADLPAEKQVATLVGLVGLDLEGYKAKRKAVEQDRTEKNREVAREQAAARSVGTITNVQKVDEAPLIQRPRGTGRCSARGRRRSRSRW